MFKTYEISEVSGLGAKSYEISHHLQSNTELQNCKSISY